MAAHGLCFFADALFRGLFIGLPGPHLAENALTLHSLFQNAKGLLYIIVSNEYLHEYLLYAAAAAIF
ncbi:hypothetical protein D3C78_1185140 [compost metagenome]